MPPPQYPMLACDRWHKAGSQAKTRVRCRGCSTAQVAETSGGGAGVRCRDEAGTECPRCGLGALRLLWLVSGGFQEPAQRDVGDPEGGVGGWFCH